MLTKIYHGSLFSALATVYPDHEWLEWMFQGVPRGFWKKQENTRRYFEWLGPKLGVKRLEDWYSFTTEDWDQYGSGGFMSHIFDNSRKKALQRAFPEHDWDAKRFKVYSYDVQSQEELRLMVQRQLAPQLHVAEMEDWYRVSWSQVRTAGFSKLLSKYGGMIEFLTAAYPDHQWDKARFHSQKTKPSQRILRLGIEQIFPNQEIKEEFVLPTTASLRNPMPFDIGVPGFNLVFEYQGEHHYKDAYRYGQQDVAQFSDLDKAAACTRANFTLITVPHWWDGSRDALANTIRLHRPDLFPDPIGDGIPITKPPG